MLESVGDPVLEPPETAVPAHCACETCPVCNGKPRSPDCSHGDDDQPCRHRSCDCGRILNLWEAEVGDMCEICFDGINRERFDDKPYAVFAGWQEQEPGFPPFPLFNVGGHHPKRNSTVGVDTLWESAIQVPWIPTFQTYKSWPSNWRTH